MDKLYQTKKGGIVIPNTDFITRTLNISEDDVEGLNVSFKDDVVTYDITLKRREMSCPLCGGNMIGHGHNRPKPIKSSNIREHKNIILYRSNRYLCKECGHTLTQDNPFTFSKFSTSFQLMRSVLTYLGNLNYTLDMISKELRISNTQVNNYLDSFITIPKLELPEWLGIDEIHNPELSYKNSSYLCVLVDGNQRCIYDVLGSRSKDYLSNHFSVLTIEERSKVKYVTIDLWSPYKEIALKYFPNCIVAVDPYHYVSHLCDGFDRLRINLMNQCVYGSNAYYLLKKWNWLLTTDDVNLDNDRVYNNRFKCKLNRRDIFDMIIDNFPILANAYYLKEEFRKFVKESDYDNAVKNYDNYVNNFKESEIYEYNEFTNILVNWKEEILNSFLKPYDDHKLSNALTESINGKLGNYLSISHGIVNFTRFRKRILYALNPKIYYSLTSVLSSDKHNGRKRGTYNKVKE